MIQKLRDHKINLLNQISPSQYYSAINCPYKLVLANSFGYESLLPMNANAHFGSITHKMIELISRGLIVDEQTFNKNWIELVNKKENELKSKGLSYIVPLKYFVDEFALKKNQIKNILQRKKEKINHSQKSTANKYYPEKRLENSDKSITGIADLIIENDSGVAILDFKTGKIYSDSINEYGNIEQVIKKEYEFQLKLYAHLYFLMHGQYPVLLYLVTLANTFVEIDFTNEDCERVYNNALNLIFEINQAIADNKIELIAKPSEENCKYCSYRPACNYYKKWLKDNFKNTNDLAGILQKITSFNNNTIGIQLLIEEKQVLINGFPGRYNSHFETLISKNIILHNLKKTKQSLNATANNFTIVYEF